MLELGAIQPSSSPWASPVVLVEKKDGNVHFCVDYCKVNQVAKVDAYPMPRAEDVLEEMGPAKYISTLDLARGYWQVPMAEDSKEKTAFTTPFGLCMFNVMPFGLHTAPATFQRLMNQVLKECQGFSQSYIDDLVVYSKSREEHLQHLRKVFRCLQKAGLTLKLPKCQFGRNKVHYLGHVIGDGEILPGPQKVEAVQRFQRPEMKTQVNSFIGLTSYYQKFVPDYASIATSLTNLLCKKQPERVTWSDECEAAFQMAAAWAVKHFEHYLYGQSFTLITNHRPLTWLKTMKTSN